MRAVWLATTLRGAGLSVVEFPGNVLRGTEFEVDRLCVTWHHDASPAGPSPGVPAYMARQIDRGLAGAQLWVDRAGVWVIVATGKVSHAGSVLRGMPGNASSLGVETDHTVGEDWPLAQLASLRKGTRAILDRQRLGVDALHFHKSVCLPVGRKVDPHGLDLGAERHAVANAAWAAQNAPVRPAPPAPEVRSGQPALAVDGDFGPRTIGRLQQSLNRTGANPQLVEDGDLGMLSRKALQARLNHTHGPVAIDGALGPQSYRALQRNVGASVDGIFGPATVRALQSALNAREL